MFLGQNSHYEERKGNPQSWQDIHARDMLAIFHGDERYATEEGKRRIELLRKIYPKVDGLKRVELFAHNGARIYILGEPEHGSLLDRTFRKIVDKRCSVIEGLVEERKQAEQILKFLPRTTQRRLIEFAMENDTVESINGHKVSPREIRLLQRLSIWRPQGEGEIVQGLEILDESEPGEDEVVELNERKDDIPI